MLIIEKQLLTKPFVDVIQHEYLLDDLLDGVSEYISDNLSRAIIKGEQKKVFYVSGMARKHHLGLANYLNSKVLDKHKIVSEVARGEFAGFPTRHTWLKINDLIIDLTISQFKDKRIDTYAKIRQLLDSQCFMCDNPSNIIYRLYKQDAKR